MTLETINETLESQRKAGKSVCITLDLDSTLYEVNTRTERILHEAAVLPAIRELDPTAAEALENVSVHVEDWGIREVMSRYQIKATIDSFEAVRQYWVKHFFSHDYLAYDQVAPGALDWVKDKFEKGFHIHYLTGRDIPRMGVGTRKRLEADGFPLEEPNCKLHMKPRSGLPDDHYKTEVTKHLTGQFDEVWFFENEPVNLYAVERALPDVHLVFFDSVHSRKMTSPDHMMSLSGRFK